MYRRGDIFVQKQKGIVAVLTEVNKDTYSFVYSNPNKKEDGWGEIKDKPISQIKEALERGDVVMYRAYTPQFDDELFKAE
jgi:hypothetical protein